MLYIILGCFVSGCGKKLPALSKKEATKEVAYTPVWRQYQAHVEGVECALCAQDAVDIIKGLKGVGSAEFICTGTDYEQGFVRFYYDIAKENLDLKALDESLQQIGFELAQLHGVFYLEPLRSGNKKYVALSDEIAMPFDLNDNAELLKKMIQDHPEKLFAEGIIKRDPQENTYYFTFLGQG